MKQTIDMQSEKNEEDKKALASYYQTKRQRQTKCQPKRRVKQMLVHQDFTTVNIGKKGQHAQLLSSTKEEEVKDDDVPTLVNHDAGVVESKVGVDGWTTPERPIKKRKCPGAPKSLKDYAQPNPYEFQFRFPKFPKYPVN